MKDGKDFLFDFIESPVFSKRFRNISRISFVIFLFIFLFIILIFRIRYSVDLPAVIYPSELPVALRVKSDMTLDRIMVSNRSKVNAGDDIFIFDGVEEYDCVMRLKKFLENLDMPSKVTLEESFSFFSQCNFSFLIEEQDKFLSDFTNLVISSQMMENHYRSNLDNSILLQTNKKKEVLRRKVKLLNSELEVFNQDISRDSMLLNDSLISDFQFNSSRKIFLNKNQETLDSELSLLGEDLFSTQVVESFKKDSVDLQFDYDKFNYDFFASKLRLLNRIYDWEEIHVIKAPISGVLAMPQLLSKNSFVKSDDVLAYISPSHNSFYLAKVNLPVANSRLVSNGDIVKVRIENLPFEEFGYLKGRILSKSNFLLDHEYIECYIKVDSLVTSNGMNIPYDNDLKGLVTINYSSVSFVDLLFSKLKFYD